MENIMKIVKSLEDSGLLIKPVFQAIGNEIEEQKVGFRGMLLGTLVAGNMLAGKWMERPGEGVNRAGKGVGRAGEETNRAGQDFWCCLIF